jgi:hypothetical protein
MPLGSKVKAFRAVFGRNLNIDVIEKLYPKIKAIFINGDKLIDIIEKENKPENLFYIGGIHLTKWFENIKSVKLKNFLGKIILNICRCPIWNSGQFEIGWPI